MLAILFAALPAAPASTPVIGRAAPAFTALNTSGQKRTLSEFRGRPVVLIFFCGCSRYSDLARQWGDLQRGGVLEMKTPAGKTPVTIAVVESGAKEMRKYLEENGLMLSRSVLIPDPQSKLTLLYGADPGPRLFVLDGRGIVRYAGTTTDAGEGQSHTQAVVAQALSALRVACSSSDKAK